ncbi:hypothetical protein DFJ74DRAFT_760379 [Hyaloraphidium curvatum]|nr:hypothetical protein DFJ74DRAFT_760379 [Hyaloraphidium curvatum]
MAMDETAVADRGGETAVPRRRSFGAPPREPSRGPPAGHPREPRPGGPQASQGAPPAGTPSAADDVHDELQLTPQGEAALLQAFLAAVPPDSPALHRPSFREAHGVADADEPDWRDAKGAPFEAGGGDPRWRAYYRHPAFRAAVHWVGAEALLHVFPATQEGFAAVPLGQLRTKADAQLQKLLDAGLDAFWAAPPEELSSPEHLALQVALLVRIVYIGVQARGTLSKLLDMWRRCGVPGDEDHPAPPDEALDEWLFRQQFVNIFWVAMSFDGWFALDQGDQRLADPLRDFPTAPFPFPARLLSTIPGPGHRPPDAQLPPHLRARIPSFDCTGYLGWLDPLRPVHDPAAREAALEACVSRLDEAGDTHLAGLIVYLHFKTAEFGNWLKDAGLNVVELLCAEDALQRPGERADPAIAAAVSHPLLTEAVRRRTYLRRALAAIESSLPPALADAARDADAAAFDAAADALAMPQLSRQQLLGYLTLLRLNAMLLSSPAPFADLEGPEPDGPGSPDDSPLIHLWSLTPAFADAARSAMAISGAARMLLSRGAAEVARDPFVHAACHSATAASWMHLLVLRRFRWMVARAPEHEQARALQLYEGLSADVRSCLDLLDASGRDGHRRVRLLLLALLEGDRTRLSPADVQMMRLASQTARNCPHGTPWGGEGQCWACAAEQPREGDRDESSSEWGSVLSAAEGRRARRVRFADEVEECETYSKEEYPARSMLAPDLPEDAEMYANAARAEALIRDTALASMLGARGVDVGQLPNLRAYW